MNLQTSSFQQIGVITRLTFREAWRRKLLWIGLVLGGMFIALYTVGFYFGWKDYTENVPVGRQYELIFISFFQLAGLYVVNFLVIMVAVLTSVGSISDEIQTNTIHAVAAKAIRRWEIVLGKWLGHAIMLTLYTLILAVGIITTTFIVSGYTPTNVVSAVLVMILESLVVLSVTMAGSSMMSTLATGVVVFMLYGVAFVGGWVEQIGSILGSQTAVDIGIASSLLMPSEGLWRYASSLMQVDMPLGLPSTPFSVMTAPTPLFVGYSVLYALVFLGGAMWALSRRDF